MNDAPEAAPLHAEAPAHPTLAARLDLAGRYARLLPDAGVSQALTLPRAKVGVGAGVGPASGRVLLAAVRSGGDADYVGVEGEALLAEVQVAEARLDLRGAGLAVGAGLVDDGWVVTGERAWGLPAVAPALGESLGWLDRSDVGGWAGWTSPGRELAVRAELTTGEGARGRERNDGKDLGGIVTARPLADHPDALVVQVYGRQGSRGLAAARDHRVGARVSGATPWADAGVEALAAWGVDGDAERAPWALSGWAVAHPWRGAVGLVRYDRAVEVAGDPEAVTGTVHLGAGWDVVDGPDAGRLLLGWSYTRAGDAVAAVAGADALAAGHALHLQLDLSIGVAAR